MNTIPNDDFSPGAVLLAYRLCHKPSGVYPYALLKGENGLWYATGRRRKGVKRPPYAATWQEVLEWFGDDLISMTQLSGNHLRWEFPE